MHTKKYIQYLFSTACLLLVGCKMPQLAQQPAALLLPNGFTLSKDTGCSATIPFKQFITDPHLITLIDTALHNNWDVQIALQRINAAQFAIMAAKGALLPSVSGNTTASASKYGDYTMNGAGNNNTLIYKNEYIPQLVPDFSIGFKAAWEIDAWGKLKNKKKAATARFLASVEGKNLIITNLVATVSNAYVELLSNDQILKIIDETIELQQNALDIVKTQKEAAVTTELAVTQFEAQLLHLRSLRIETIQRISETEITLNLLVGRYPQPIKRDSQYFKNTIWTEIKTGLPPTLLQNRPDIRQAELSLIAAKADVQAAKAAFYPSLNIGGNLGFDAFKPSLLAQPQSFFYDALGGITAPLVNKAALKAEFGQANALQLEALYNYQKTIVTGFAEVFNELQKIKNQQSNLVFKTEEVAVLTQSIDISSNLFRYGRANYLEVLIAQQNALTAKLSLIDNKKNQLLSRVNLYKALGGGCRL